MLRPHSSPDEKPYGPLTFSRFLSTHGTTVLSCFREAMIVGFLAMSSTVVTTAVLVPVPTICQDDVELSQSLRFRYVVVCLHVSILLLIICLCCSYK